MVLLLCPAKIWKSAAEQMLTVGALSSSGEFSKLPAVFRLAV